MSFAHVHKCTGVAMSENAPPSLPFHQTAAERLSVALETKALFYLNTFTTSSVSLLLQNQ